MSMRVVAFQRPQTRRSSYSRRLPQRPPSSQLIPTPATTPTGSIKRREAVMGGPISSGPSHPRIMDCRQGGGAGAALAAGKGPRPPLCPPARRPLTRAGRSMQYSQQRSYGRCALFPSSSRMCGLLLRVCLCCGRVAWCPRRPGHGRGGCCRGAVASAPAGQPQAGAPGRPASEGLRGASMRWCAPRCRWQGRCVQVPPTSWARPCGFSQGRVCCAERRGPRPRDHPPWLCLA